MMLVMFVVVVLSWNHNSTRTIIGASFKYNAVGIEHSLYYNILFIEPH